MASRAEGVVVLGVDPGTRCTGYGVVQERSGCVTLVAAGALRPPAKAPMDQRLGALFAGLDEVLALHSPHEAALEEAFTHKNAASALKLGQARGAIMAACAVRGVPVTGYQPTLVKQAVVGTGRAEKEQVAFMVRQTLGALKATWPLDVTDALAVALCHLNARRLARLVDAASGGRR